MGKSISILIVDDSEDDALLLLAHLRRAGFDPEWRRVDGSDAMVDALEDARWDLVISDHRMPNFSAPAALQLVRNRGLDVPFIIVSGNIGDDVGIASMKAGANDYLGKDNLARLPGAIERELRGAQQRGACREAEAKLRYLAHYDQLTALPNRAQLCDRLAQLLGAPDAARSPVSVFQVRLDNLQDVTNTLGHEVRGRVLREISLRFAQVARDFEMTARVGGDQFVLVLRESEYEGLFHVAHELKRAIEAPVRIDETEVMMVAAIGIASCSGAAEAPELLLQRANVAVAQTARAGHRIALYDRERDPYRPQRLAMIAELRRAIESGQLVLHYQPKISFATGELIGVEALVRWPHPSLGLLQPDQFIPLAEQTGLIHPLTHWVLKESLLQSSVWYKRGLDLVLAANLSAKSLQTADVGERLLSVLGDFWLASAKLQLEVTESAIMTDEPHVRSLFSQLHADGVGIAIDDFGTGYSSLANLRRLPVSEIKIDKSFVTGMATSEEDRIIVSSIIELGHNLGMQVVAEGVETAATWRALADFGCDLAQGYYLTPPLPPAELATFAATFVPPSWARL